MPLQPNGLPLKLPTIADKLKEQGYATHAVGKWHLGYYTQDYMPTRRGFDSYFGLLEGYNDHFAHEMCFPFNGTFVCGLNLHLNEEPAYSFNGSYSTELFSDRVCDIVKEHAANNPEQPLFIYVPFQAPHTPLQVPDEYIDPGFGNETDNRIIYAGMVSAVDVAVKKITDTFKENGLWDDTITIFSTDNGGNQPAGANNYPLRAGKGSLFEGGVRGVGFVHGNMLNTTGVINHELIHVSDWFPTLLNLAGGDTTDLELDGYDVWDAISNESPSPRTEILHNIDPLANPRGNWSYSDVFDTRIRAAIRVGDWKLITGNPTFTYIIPEVFACISWENEDSDINGNGIMDCVEPDDTEDDLIIGKNLWLFNIKDDPAESMDLSEQYPAIVEELLGRMAYYNSTAVPATFPPLEQAGIPENNGGVWGPWVD